MKTLAELKRHLSLGTQVTLTAAPIMPNHKNLNVPRFVVRVQGVAIELSPDKDAKRGSALYFPKASLISFSENSFSFHAPTVRPMAKEEEAIYNNRPSNRPENKERYLQDAMCDGNMAYYADKKYFADNDAEYFNGNELVNGKRFDFNTKQIHDETMRGDIELTYSF